MSFLLRPVFTFRRSSSASTRGVELHASVTPYPLAPHLEGCVLDIGVGRDASIVPLSEGEEARRSATRSENRSRALDNKTLPTAPKRPLGVVTNFTRVAGARRKSVPAPSKRRGAENSNGNTNQENETPKKQSPVRRMPRYLNLARTSPTKSHGPNKHTPSFSSFHVESPTKAKAKPDISSESGSPGASPSKLESCLAHPADESVDWAARIRSVFYNKTWDADGEEYKDDDLPESIREFFTRDSVGSDESVDGGTSTSNADASEDDYGRPFSARSTCYSPSSPTSLSSSPDSSADSESLATPTHGHPHALSGVLVPASSELPYLGGSSNSHSGASGLSASSSGASGAFNDLLASVGRKYPGRHWPEIVQFGGPSEDGHGHGHGGRGDGGRACGGSINGGKGLQQWSDVFCLEEYAS